MNDFSLPSNIKQIGSIGEGLKVYVEDYVMTFLKQHAKEGGLQERIAYLVGKELLIDGESYLFISGAILGKYSEIVDGITIFSPQSEEYLNEQMTSYFAGYNVVGMMQSQPGFGTHLNPSYADYFMNHFTEPNQVLFVMDQMERLNAFYIWDTFLTSINEASGYMIYYDKNEGMQEYMLDNRPQKVKQGERIVPNKTQSKDTKTAYESKTPKKTVEQAALERKTSLERLSGSERKTPESIFRQGSSSEIPQEKGGEEYKRVVNMLVSLSAVLFIICFIMGAGLIQSDGRIGNLEKDFASINNDYNYLVAQVKQLNTQTVFANQDPTIDLTNNNTTPVPQPTTVLPSTTATVSKATAAPVFSTNQPATQTTNPTTAAISTPKPTIAPTISTTPKPSTATPSALPSQALAPNSTSTAKPIQTTKPTTIIATTSKPTATASVTTAKPTASPQASVPSSNPTSTTPSNEEFETYIVQKGDSLLYISEKFYGTVNMVDKIMELNGMTNPDTIFYGKVLKLPKE